MKKFIQIPEISDKQWSFSIPQEIESLPDTEKMLLIRNRKRQNQDKVRKFFGSDLKIDVSLSMINKFKLPAMIESDLPLTYFISFLIKYQGAENLFFLLEVERFKETNDCFETKKTFAQRIFSTFMENGLPMQINTKNTIIEDARSMLSECTEQRDFELLFNTAHLDIYSMLMNVYNEFEKSDFYTQMINDLSTPGLEMSRDNLALDSSSGSSSNGGNACGSIYPMKAYYNALDLIAYSVGCMEKVYDEQMASKRVSINRNRQIRRMIVSFCEQRLKMDFPESSLNLRKSLLTDPDANISVSGNQRSSIISNFSVFSNTSQSNSVKRKDELDLF